MIEINTINTFENDFTHVKEKVDFILKHNKNSRNDDLTLCFLYWYKFDNLAKQQSAMESIFIKYGNMFNIKGKFTTPETIVRARRIIQNEENRYLPDDNTKVERMIRQQEYIEMAIKNKHVSN